MRDEITPALTHLDGKGRARMVDVGAKAVTRRRAVASGAVSMLPGTLDMIVSGRAAKGDVLAVGRLEEKLGGRSGHYRRGSGH